MAMRTGATGSRWPSTPNAPYVTAAAEILPAENRVAARTLMRSRPLRDTPLNVFAPQPEVVSSIPIERPRIRIKPSDRPDCTWVHLPPLETANQQATVAMS